MVRHVTLANAEDLVTWAGRLDAQSVLPRLIRRLVLASTKGLRQVSFRAGGVQLEGWDGITVAEGPHAFVPTGVAGWELSVRRDIEAKADEDYDKRLVGPNGVEPSKASFVFVTPRRWPGKQDWAARRMREGRWRSVVSLDADDLEAWLDPCPAVHQWFSAELGKPAAYCHP